MELYTLKECKKKPIKKQKSKYELYANKMVIKKKGGGNQNSNPYLGL